MASTKLIVFLALTTLGFVALAAAVLRVRVEKKKASGERSELEDLEMYKQSGEQAHEGSR
ncbi:MAG: hypothetical protein V2J89_08300 [Halieaceae bacterium]|jgi:hypothetical protein|nr:hypothetical protein [Halieaceae bacterium]